ncbi:hypothetical protein ScPMuIL_018735 [Solemya velum]
MVWGAVAGMGFTQIIGMIWYHKYFLGRFWQRATFPGKTEDQINQLVGSTSHIAFPMTLTAHAALVMMLNYVVGKYLGIKTVESAIKVGIFLWTVVTMTEVPHLMFAQQSVVAFIINHLYDAAVFVTVCTCLVYFG